MKKYSMFGVFIHHPFKSIILCGILLYALSILLNWLQIPTSTNALTVILLISFLLSLYLLKRHYNKKIKNGTYREPKHRLLGFLLSSAVGAHNASSRREKQMQDAMMNAFTGSRSSQAASDARYRAQRQQADAAARARWDAIDRQKKAEYDARDAALRGKDKAARQYKNDADYWYNQSKK